MFSPDSLNIMRFLSTPHGRKKLSRNKRTGNKSRHINKTYVNYDRLIEIDEDLLKPLFTLLKKNEEYDYHIKKEIKIKNLELNKYIAPTVRKYIDNKIKFRYDYVLTIKNKIINLCINSDKEITDNKMDIFLSNLISSIGIVVMLEPMDKIIDLVIYITPHKKKCDDFKYRQNFTVDEVNSGSTMCCKEPYIIVCRKEELFKVIIHELIHALNFDIKHDDSYSVNKIKDILNIESPYNMYEAYTEIWANILNAFFIANMIKNKSREETFNTFIELLKYEQKWSIFQAAKIMTLTNCRIEPHIRYTSIIELNKYTNVFSYFILRSFIFFRFNDFMRKCRDNNINYINLNANIEFFSNYILNLTLEVIYNKDYKLLLKRNKRVLNYLKDLNNHKKNKNLIKSKLLLTIRMSACELYTNI